MKAITMTGARALLKIRSFDSAGSEQTAAIGIFNDVSFSYSISVEPVFTLGRYEAQELTPVSQEPVSISARGFKIVNYGLYEKLGMATLNNTNVNGLLNHEDFLIELSDRQTKQNIVTVYNCRPTSVSMETNAKGQMSLSMNFMGIKMHDEKLENSVNSDGTASTYGLPDPNPNS